jgi:hypothetical protein
MITKSDWEDAYQDLLAEGRERLGPPPTVEKVLALYAGQLDDAEAEKVRELLSYYPEMARVMTDTFPTEADGVLTGDEVAADRAKLRTFLGLDPAAPPVGLPKVASLAHRLPAWQLATAAIVVIAIGIGGYAAWLSYRMPSEERIFHADGQRGASLTRGPAEQTPIQLLTDTRYHLKVVFRPEQPYREYRMELFALATGRSIWTQNGLQRQPDGFYPVDLSTKGILPGRYQFVLSGVNEKAVPLATYTVRLSRRQQ